MHLILFDIDGTLLRSNDFDTECFQVAVREVLGMSAGPDWSQYRHVTDSGILRQLIEESGFQDEAEDIFNRVKKRLVHRVTDYVSSHGVSPVAGAPEFLSRLVARRDIALAFATGGWLESAKIKLAAAGMDFPQIPLVSSSDDYRRIEIMKLAEERAGGADYKSRSYFGDGPWDREASEALGYNFVLVGDGISYPQSIPDFTQADRALAYIGL